ncbi:MAG: hypothetical protein ACYC7A_19640 [Thermoanaerobaculia bacterium]
MDHLLLHFERPVYDQAGTAYMARLFGRKRPDMMWEGWLVFERTTDGARTSTPIETTQSNPAAVVHWAAGLSDAYFEGAILRAAREPKPESASPAAIVESGNDRDEREARIATIGHLIVDAFRHSASPRLLTSELFTTLPYANADIVRALERVEKESRLIVRKTEAGYDWVYLTEKGLRAAGLEDLAHGHAKEPIDRPKPRQ